MKIPATANTHKILCAAFDREIPIRNYQLADLGEVVEQGPQLGAVTARDRLGPGIPTRDWITIRIDQTPYQPVSTDLFERHPSNTDEKFVGREINVTDPH